MNHVRTRTAAPTTDKRVQRPDPSRPQDRDTQTLYQVPLTAADLRLIRACSNWICRLEPAPDIRARLVHLEQRLAGARPDR
jgi:hypothetical protein